MQSMKARDPLIYLELLDPTNLTLHVGLYSRLSYFLVACTVLPSLASQIMVSFWALNAMVMV